MQKNIDNVLEQRRSSGKRVLPHVNHPNFGWAIAAEDLMHVRGDRFIEIYNGHPAVHNEGDADHASAERMWDITLAFRLGKLKLPALYGLAVDDAHNYHNLSVTQANMGRGWVMVRALRLSTHRNHNGAGEPVIFTLRPACASSKLTLPERVFR